MSASTRAGWERDKKTGETGSTMPLIEKLLSYTSPAAGVQPEVSKMLKPSGAT